METPNAERHVQCGERGKISTRFSCCICNGTLDFHAVFALVQSILRDLYDSVDLSI